MTVPRYLNPPSLLTPVAPYSHVSRAADLVHLAGQAGEDADGRLVSDRIDGQLAQAFENIRLALDSQGLGLDSVVKLTIYLVGRETVPDFVSASDALMPRLFPHGYPPSTVVIVQGLFAPDFLVEIDAVAVAR